MADISGHILQHKWHNILDNSTPQLGVSPSRTLELTADKITEAFLAIQFSFQIIHCYYFCGDHFLAVITKFPSVIFFYLLYLYSKKLNCMST